MSERWMYRTNGRDVGPVSLSELQELATTGVVSSTTEVRALRSSFWQQAASLAELEFPVPSDDSLDASIEAKTVRSTNVEADKWFCRSDGTVVGPIRFDDLVQMASTRQLLATDEVRLESSQLWRQVGSIGRLMAALPYSNVVPQKKNNLSHGNHSQVKSLSQNLDTVVKRTVQFRSVSSESRLPEQQANKTVSAAREANTGSKAVYEQARQQIAKIIEKRTQSKPVAADALPLNNAKVIIEKSNDSESNSNQQQLRPVEIVAPQAVSSVIGSSNIPQLPTPIPAMKFTPSIEARSIESLSNPRPMPGATSSPAFVIPRAKRAAPISHGPTLLERLKSMFTGEHNVHIFALLLAVGFLAYWYVPRKPVRAVAVHPVKGSVVMNGNPVANAIICLHQVGKRDPKVKLPKYVRPHAKSDADGTFELETFEAGDGAYDGEFVVTVYMVEEKVDQDGDVTYGPNLLPAIYSKPDTSPFKLTITSTTRELETLELTKS